MLLREETGWEMRDVVIEALGSGQLPDLKRKPKPLIASAFPIKTERVTISPSTEDAIKMALEAKEMAQLVKHSMLECESPCSMSSTYGCGNELPYSEWLQQG